MKKSNIDKLLNVDMSKIMKRATFWNMVASVLNAITTAVLLFFITRLCGVKEAGIFSIASAIAYQCLSLGNFGVRSFHASDVKREFSFSDYFYLRVFSYSLSFISLLYFTFFSGYTNEKMAAVFAFGLFKSIDIIEDLYHGEYHRNNRLDIAASLLAFRYLLSIIIFVICIVFSRSVTISSLLTAFCSFIIFLLCNHGLIQVFYNQKYKFSFIKFKTLLWIMVPIVITNYLKLYITNSPKYAIDACLGDSEQAIFNILFIPVFVISLLSDIIFRPYIPKFSKLWHECDIEGFRIMAIRQFLVIVALTVIIMFGGYILGLTLLEIIYGTQLHAYMVPFQLLLLGGGFTTIGGFLILILTIQREQKKMAIINIVTFLICILISNYLVSNFGILGASYLYLFLNILPVIFLSVIVIWKYRKHAASSNYQ